MKKAVAVISLFILSSYAQSNCICVGFINQQQSFQAESFNKKECAEKVFNYLYDSRSHSKACESDKGFTLSWSCEKYGEKKLNLESSTLSCDETNSFIAFREVVRVSNELSVLHTDPQKIEPSLNKHSQSSNCSEVAATSNQESQGVQNGLRIEIESDEEFKTFLKEISGSEEHIPGLLFDAVQKNKLTYSLINDNRLLGLLDIITGKRSDDIGYTHGYKITFERKAGSKGYVIGVDFQADLYTNFDAVNENVINGFTNEDGLRHFNTYFLQKNVLSFFAKKVKSGKGVFGNVRGGYVGIDQSLGEDGLNNTNIFSTLSQQTGFHYLLAEVDPDLTYIPIYLSQPEGNRKGAFLEAEVGYEVPLHKSSSILVTTPNSVALNASTIKGASHIKTSNAIEINYQKRPKSFAVRGNVGVTTEIYTTGEVIFTPKAEVRFGTPHKYEFFVETLRRSKEANYLDPIYNNPGVQPDPPADVLMRVGVKLPLKF